MATSKDCDPPNSGVQASARKSKLPTAAGAKSSPAAKYRARSGSMERPGSFEPVSLVSAGIYLHKYFNLHVCPSSVCRCR